MKKIILAVALTALLFSSFESVAQHRRFNDRYAYRRTQPLRPSVSVVASLPFGTVALSFGQRYYHYYDGYYYSPYNSGYLLVDPPVGLVVPALPRGSVAVVVGARSYYRFQSVFYLPLGPGQYQVVEKPAETETTAATAKASPADYEKITLEGKTYYRKDGKYYKASIDDNGEISYQEVGETVK